MAPDGGGAVRVMLVDDESSVRALVAAFLGEAGDMEVCCEASSVAEAAEAAAVCRPDVAVVDLRLGDGSGIRASRLIRARSPGTRILLLTASPEDEAALAAFMAGAHGYVVKQPRAAAVVESVRAVAGGRRLLGLEASAVVERRSAALDDDERSLLARVLAGDSDADIAAAFELDEDLVRRRVERLNSSLLAAGRFRGGPPADGGSLPVGAR